LFLRPLWIKTNQSDYKDERLELFTRDHLAKYDIMCFQEVFGLWNSRKQKIIKRALKEGFMHFAESPSPSFFSP
jgi:hypothetical protein